MRTIIFVLAAAMLLGVYCLFALGEVPANSGWKTGPLDSGTWQYGAVVLRDGIDKAGKPTQGFHFADFHGDYARIYEGKQWVRVEAKDILFYNNSLVWPIPTVKVTPEIVQQPAPVFIDRSGSNWDALNQDRDFRVWKNPHRH